MAAEQDETIQRMQDRMKKLEDDLDKLRERDSAKQKQIELLQEDMKKIELIKDDFGDKLQVKLQQMSSDLNMADGRLKQHQEAINVTYVGAQEEFERMRQGNQQKFEEMAQGLSDLHQGAEIKFKEVEEMMRSSAGKSGHKRSGFLPDKMMVPKIFSGNIEIWRKWRGEVTKYFDEEKEGMKSVMEEVAKHDEPVTQQVLQQACLRYPGVLIEQLQHWKHLYRALEKLTDGEARKVIDTVVEENGFEAWRQLHLRFEPELEAQKNVVLLEIHSILPSTAIEETKTKLVELKVRIAKAEEILEERVTEMQKKTALLQILDPITKQHTATVKEASFNKFYTIVMNFANNASIGGQGAGPAAAEKVHRVAEKDNEEEGYGDEFDDGWLNAVGGGGGECHVCGKYGHWARECPLNKGKGKGKDGMGSPKGKGKGKGPATGCWECGGAHFRDQCPKLSLKGKSSGKGFGGKKGSGKGNFGGKGKGGIYAMQQSWGDGYFQGDEWAVAAEAFCCLRTVEPHEMKPKVKLSNMFSELEEEEWEEEVTAPCNEDIRQDEDESQQDDAAEPPAFNDDAVKAAYDKRGSAKKNCRDKIEFCRPFRCSDPACLAGVGWDSTPCGKPHTEGFARNHDPIGGLSTIIQEQKHAERLTHRMPRVKMPRVRRWRKMAAPMQTSDTSQVNLFKTVQPETINTVSDDGLWEEIKFSVDSGATETVVPPEMPESIPTVPGLASKRGVEYEVANGVTIPNEGEKRFTGITEEGQEKSMVVQVCDVNQGLLSVSKAVAMGNRVVFDDQGSYIENKMSGDRTWMRAEGGMYTLRMWVKRPF